jgi:hypothetical protein
MLQALLEVDMKNITSIDRPWCRLIDTVRPDFSKSRSVSRRKDWGGVETDLL